MVQKICIVDFYCNLTKPYFKFIKGNKYKFTCNKFKIYFSMDCDYTFTESDIGLYFQDIDIYRNNIIDKILD